jgi:hypothetical protein
VIYIKETIFENNSITIKTDGILNRESIPILENICEDHLKNHKKILLRFDNIIHISREGRDFLRELEEKGIQVDLPQFFNIDKY